MRGEGHPRPVVAGNAGMALGGAHEQIRCVNLLHLKRNAREVECITGRKRGGEKFIQLPQPPPVPKAHSQHRRIHDNPGVQSVLCGKAGVRDAPAPVPVLHQPPEPVVGFQRIAAG